MPTQGKRLKNIREKLKLNQTEFADKLNIKSQSVWKAEKNINKLSNDNLFNLVSQFNINLNYLISGKGEMFINETIQPSEELRAMFQEELTNLLCKYGLIDKIK